jgi:steroid delta-isomerase-like uncharacterized protein
MTTDLAAFAETINDAWNSHDMENVLRFYAPDCVSDDVGQGSQLHGREGLRLMLQMYWSAFPDLRFQITDTVIQESRLAIAWMAEGTHEGAIMNIPPTGHQVEVRGMSIVDVQDGMVVRAQYLWDIAGMLRHMGLLPQL